MEEDKKLSFVAKRFLPSPIQQLSLLAQQCNAINLAEGFPDFPAPLTLKNAAISAINSDFNQYRWGYLTFILRNFFTHSSPSFMLNYIPISNFNICKLVCLLLLLQFVFLINVLNLVLEHTRHVQGVCDELAKVVKKTHGLNVNPLTDFAICCGQTEAFAAAVFSGTFLHFLIQFHCLQTLNSFIILISSDLKIDSDKPGWWSYHFWSIVRLICKCCIHCWGNSCMLLSFSLTNIGKLIPLILRLILNWKRTGICIPWST